MGIAMIVILDDVYTAWPYLRDRPNLDWAAYRLDCGFPPRRGKYRRDGIATPLQEELNCCSLQFERQNYICTGLDASCVPGEDCFASGLRMSMPPLK